jgi:hypothetical protein
MMPGSSQVLGGYGNVLWSHARVLWPGTRRVYEIMNVPRGEG